jgi:hypothetical protein
MNKVEKEAIAKRVDERAAEREQKLTLKNQKYDEDFAPMDEKDREAIMDMHNPPPKPNKTINLVIDAQQARMDFACAAMSGMVARASYSDDYKHIANVAFLIADAMLKESHKYGK